jgi:Xaa-Pro aminopeptidase
MLFCMSVFRDRLGRLRLALKHSRVEAFVVFTEEGENRNVFYLSGFSGTAAMLLVTRRYAFIVSDPRYAERIRSEAPDFSPIVLGRNERYSDVLLRLFKRARVSREGRVGYEGFRTPVLTLEVWKKRMRPYRLFPLEDIVGRNRQYKSKEEIVFLRDAARRTSRAFADIRRRVRSGMREREVALEIDIALRRHGAVENSFETIVASGPNAAIPHHHTGERRLKAGDAVVMDFGGRYPSGYASDLTRTVFVSGKKPDPELLSIYKIVLAANRAATRGVKAGMTWRDYDALARSHIAEKGYEQYFTHSVGHSLGLEAHDPYDYRNDPIRVGTVFTNEPGIYIPGKGGVRIEDDLAMTAKGLIQLTNASY